VRVPNGAYYYADYVDLLVHPVVDPIRDGNMS
jgi:hypothetical protein